MGQTIFAPGPRIALPIPQASAWTLRVPVDKRIQVADLVTLAQETDTLVGGIDDGQWWIETVEGQVFSARGILALRQALDGPPFAIAGFGFAKHSHPGFPQAHGPEPHPQAPTLRLATVDLRRERAITLEGDDATWVAGARVVLAGRVQTLPNTQLWRRRTTLLAPLVPAVLLGAVAYGFACGSAASLRDIAS